MFWIMRGDSLLCAIMGGLFGVRGFRAAFDHVPWEGIHFMDTVFPLFLFMAGVSFPFSAAKSEEKGLSKRSVALKALRRGLTLFALGLLGSGVTAKFDFDSFRIPSVLAYIGFGWMVAAWIYLGVKRVWARLVIALGILTFVTLFFGLVPAPDAAGAGIFTPEGHFGCYLDRTLLKGHIYAENFDPEGFSGLLSTIVVAMFGMLAGDLVRRDKAVATGRKALGLLAAGAVSALAGFALSCFYPIVKALWSPSFVLVLSGYAFAMFALFYWIIDVKGWGKPFFFFQVIGMNSITIYVGQRLIKFGYTSDFLFGGLAGLFPPAWGAIVLKMGYIAVCWLFLYFLYRKNVFLKI